MKLLIQIVFLLALESGGEIVHGLPQNSVTINDSNEHQDETVGEHLGTSGRYGETFGGPHGEVFGNRVETVSSVSTRWLNKDTMQVTWPDKARKSDLMFLSPTESSLSVPSDCIFRAKFRDDVEGTAVVVGCIDSDTTIINLSGSFDLGVRELLLLANGTTLEEKILEPKIDEKLSRRKRQSETGGYLISNSPRPNILNRKNIQPPTEVTMPLQFGYETKFFRWLNSDKNKVKRFINKVQSLASVYFLQTSPKLASKITWKVLPEIILVNQEFTSDEMCNGNRDKTDFVKDIRDRNDVTFIILSEDLKPIGGEETSGCAFRSSACSKFGDAFGIVDNTWRDYSEERQKQQMARTMAHEFGHLIGMLHDFDHTDRPECDNKGVMSYGRENVNNKGWSKCSQSDWKKWWNSDGIACANLDYGSTNCGNHRAESCKGCGSRSRCNGDCEWNFDSNICGPKSGFTIKRGAGWLNSDGVITTLKEVTGTNTNACERECKKTPGCVGFTFVSSIDRCDLKTDDQAVELDYSNGDSIFSGTLKLRPGTGWHNSRGSINSIDEVRAEKASQCENPCRDTSGCVGWTYVKGPKRCDLKSEDDAVSYSFQYADVVSGLI
jgi:hypothetical protein